MSRVAVLIVAIVVALAAPVRTWCEASCLKPSAAQSHCPAHQRSDRPIMSASEADCPVIDAARPSPAARVDVGVAVPVVYGQVTNAAPGTTHRALLHYSTPAPPHQLNTPLRI